MSTQPPNASTIKFNLLGIAEILKNLELCVPIYQRSYAWKATEQVEDFWLDLERAYEGIGEYFLGTVVLASDGPGGRKTVIDGQQRLATTSLLITAIKSKLALLGTAKATSKALVVSQGYLARETLESDGQDPRLVLNSEDDIYFRKLITDDEVSEPSTGKPSHALLREAFFYFHEKISEEIKNTNADNAMDHLLGRINFLTNRARVGVIEVPTEADAYVIFETLNNRGADLTTADLLKNYLYSMAKKNIDPVRDRWMQALGTLDLTAADEKFTKFLRHYWSSMHGITREKELYKAIRERVDTPTASVEFADNLAKAAKKYAAIGNPSNEYWQNYGSASKTDISWLIRFDLAPNRPLLLAAMDTWPQNEIQKLIRSMLNWSVRGMILETMNSGSIEARYCDAAVKIRNGELKNIAHVRQELDSTIANDSAFEAAFAIARVTKHYLARYYLASLEKIQVDSSEPEWVPNENEQKVNLEHVYPRKPVAAEWQAFDPKEVNAWATRLGNMVLLSKGKNSSIGNKPFTHKCGIILSSELQLTKDVGAVAEWTPQAIEARQQKLAKLALRAWPR